MSEGNLLFIMGSGSSSGKFVPHQVDGEGEPGIERPTSSPKQQNANNPTTEQPTVQSNKVVPTNPASNKHEGSSPEKSTNRNGIAANPPTGNTL